MNTMKTLALAVATGISLTACATTANVDRPTRTVAYQPEAVTVVVENRNWQDVRVFALVGGIRHRLGTVTSMNTSRLRLPRQVGAHDRSIRILVDPIGGQETFLSPTVQVYAGQEVSLSVQNHLAISSIAVFARN